jgi:RHS repeat-associated protein
MYALLVSLNLHDTPVGYTPPVGPPVYFIANYNQKESHQPATFSYSNLGPKWTCNWISYINDNPTSPNADVSMYVSGGGIYRFTGFNTNTQGYMTELMSQSHLLKTSSATYELQSRDGSREEFAWSDGSVGASRRIFLTQFIDPAGNAVQLNYDSSLRIANITDAIGQATTLLYTNAAYPYSITAFIDPFGRAAYFQYNSSGLLSQITDVLGLSSQFTYDTNDFVTSMTTPYGTTTFANGQITGGNWLEATDPLGQTERMEFNQFYKVPDSDPPATVPHGLAVYNKYLSSRNTFFWNKKAYAEGHGDYSKATIFHFCHNSGLTTASRVLESVKKPLENRVWYNYPGQTYPYLINPAVINKPAVIARALDDGTSQLYYYAYDAFGNLTNSTDPVGRTFTYVYATNGVDLIEVRMTHSGKNELQSRTTYNSQHQPLTMTDAAGQTTTNTYNARGQILTTTDPLGGTTTYSYDTNGYLRTITGPQQNTNDITSFTYDSFGRQRTMTDPEGYTVTFDYDTLDRKTRQTHPDGTYEQYIYDRLDLAGRRDRLGRWTTNTYNAIRQLAATRDALGRTTQYDWCRCGAMTTLIDSMGRATTWRYDVQSRPVAKQFADGSTITYSYENTTSRLKSRRDENGQHTVYEYYTDNDLKRVSYPDAVAATPTVSYTYDSDYNRMLTMQDGIGISEYTYYPINPIPGLGATQVATVVGPLSNSAVAYQYDQLGRVVTRSINGVATLAMYDVLGRRTGETNALGAFLRTYVGASARLASDNYSNGQTNLYAYYDNVGDKRLRQITHLTPDGTLLSSFGYSYNAVGEILLLTNSLDTGQETRWAFAYDAANQLSSATSWQSGTLYQTLAYNYDLAGNRLAEQIGTTTNQASYNALNQLIAGSAVSNYAAYAWDAEHRLVAVRAMNQETEFAYDGLGRCVGMRHLVNGSEASDRKFLWCDDEICEERTPAGLVTKRYFAQGVKIETGVTTGPFYYVRDNLGSVRELTDGTGNIRASYDYDPFGRRARLMGDVDSDFGFAGMFWATEVSLNMARFRTYDPNSARWLTRDPLRDKPMVVNYYLQNRILPDKLASMLLAAFAGRDEANLYVYVLNDPINLTDVLGLDCHSGCNVYPPGSKEEFVCSNTPCGRWSNCVRKCLQDDWNTVQCHYNSGFKLQHAYCFIKCYAFDVVPTEY